MGMILDYGKNIMSAVSDLSVPSIITISITALLVAFALRYGKDRIVALILSLYVGLITFIHFPYTEEFILLSGSDDKLIISNAVIFLVFVFISYMVVEKVVWIEYPTGGSKQFIEALILALSATAFLIAFAYNVLPAVSTYQLAPSIEELFSSSNLFFWWLILPLVSVFILGKQ